MRSRDWGQTWDGDNPVVNIYDRIAPGTENARSLSDLGPPGTPPEKRVHFDGGVWRYHPIRRVFEAWSDGNP